MNRKFCKNCGAPLEEGSEFCTQCGQALSAPVAPQESPDAATGAPAAGAQVGAKEKKGFNPKIIIPFAGVAVAIALVLTIGHFVFGWFVAFNPYTEGYNYSELIWYMKVKHPNIKEKNYKLITVYDDNTYLRYKTSKGYGYVYSDGVYAPDEGEEDEVEIYDIKPSDVNQDAKTGPQAGLEKAHSFYDDYGSYVFLNYDAKDRLSSAKIRGEYYIYYKYSGRKVSLIEYKDPDISEEDYGKVECYSYEKAKSRIKDNIYCTYQIEYNLRGCRTKFSVVNTEDDYSNSNKYKYSLSGKTKELNGTSQSKNSDGDNTSLDYSVIYDYKDDYLDTVSYHQNNSDGDTYAYSIQLTYNSDGTTTVYCMNKED